MSPIGIFCLRTAGFVFELQPKLVDWQVGWCGVIIGWAGKSQHSQPGIDPLRAMGWKKPAQHPFRSAPLELTGMTLSEREIDPLCAMGWKKPAQHPFRAAPLELTGIPTLLKVRADGWVSQEPILVTLSYRTLVYIVPNTGLHSTERWFT
eukprot:295266-Prorocentrum_minimum.AAC.1